MVYHVLVFHSNEVDGDVRMPSQTILLLLCQVPLLNRIARSDVQETETPPGNSPVDKRQSNLGSRCASSGVAYMSG